jgi:ABC-type uncharacterized transport system substrate-binding protein
VRPGGNVTGVTLMSPDLVGRRLALLREAAPAAKRIAMLYSAAGRPAENELRETEAAAPPSYCGLMPAALMISPNCSMPSFAESQIPPKCRQ